MSYKITTDVTGQIDVNPRRVKIISTDSFATITAPGYLNSAASFGFNLLPTDIIDMVYEFSSTSNTGTYDQFFPLFGTNGSITLAVNSTLISFDIAVTATALASGGSVNLYVPLISSNQFKIRALWSNSNGTNFSGGGGDRLLSINDGTTVFSLIPAANLQTLANAEWGVTALPYPASAAINTSTVAGASLKATYSGGTTDYSAGSVVISGLLERVA